MTERNDGGPWASEGDTREFSENGFPCVMLRGPGGHWCGYVGIPKGHPLYGLGYSDTVESPPADLIHRPIDIDKVGVINIFTAGLKSGDPERECEIVLLFDVHGGLTYASGEVSGNEPEGFWWFGFDCAHSGDLCPTYASRYGETGSDIYRDAEYVAGECKSLAKQLSAYADAMIAEDESHG